ncbi:MAG: 3-hydroxyacyl-CoA dehydrogenase family protein [Bacillota bacterium]
MQIDDVKQVAVIGAGAMGRQIALNCALHGYPTTLTDAVPAVLESAARWKTEYLEGRVAKGRITRDEADAAAARLQIFPTLQEAAGGADLVIEAVIERLDVKRELFAELDRLTPPHAILATNSSTIVSSKVADATTRPAKVANFHYFNPALVMQLVEVVEGPHTSSETAEILMEFARRTGKIPIWIKKEISGFVANRLLGAVVREACFLLENGVATHEEIDLAAEKALGYPMGPFRLMDLTGIDVAYLVRKQRFEESGSEQDRPPRSIEEKYLRGEYGRKTGKGWYDYTAEGGKA